MKKENVVLELVQTLSLGQIFHMVEAHRRLELVQSTKEERKCVVGIFTELPWVRYLYIKQLSYGFHCRLYLIRGFKKKEIVGLELVRSFPLGWILIHQQGQNQFRARAKNFHGRKNFIRGTCNTNFSRKGYLKTHI